MSAATHARCQRNLKLMAAKKELPLQMGVPICAECAQPQHKRKKMATATATDTESDTEMFDGYDTSDSFVNDGSIDESEWTEDEQEQEQQEKVQVPVKKKCRKLIRPPVEESEDES